VLHSLFHIAMASKFLPKGGQNWLQVPKTWSALSEGPRFCFVQAFKIINVLHCRVCLHWWSSLLLQLVFCACYLRHGASMLVAGLLPRPWGALCCF
jgi:hypothetical protein